MINKSKAILKRVSPTTIESLSTIYSGDELLKKVIEQLIAVYNSISLQEYIEIQKELITLFESNKPIKKKKSIKDGQ